MNFQRIIKLNGGFWGKMDIWDEINTFILILSGIIQRNPKTILEGILGVFGKTNPENSYCVKKNDKLLGKIVPSVLYKEKLLA